jgi:hypothetical protein
MTVAPRSVFALACAVVFALLGWKIVEVTRADALAATDPAAALRIEPDHPAALLAAAANALRANDAAGATALARHLLAVEPAQGGGFATIALAASAQGAPDADALVRIAVMRAARDRRARARAASDDLRRGDLPGAMKQLDALMRLGANSNLLPALVAQSAHPEFAAAMADTLSRKPRWAPRFMQTLLAQGSPEAVDRIHAELRRKGALTQAETANWLRRMMRDGRWGEAFAHWVATLGPGQAALPTVYDGGFEQESSGIGFDWQPGVRSTGVFTEFEATPGASGRRAAHFRFIGPAADGDLRQPLLLAPGHYRLSLRAKAEFLDSQEGLEWRITCTHGPVIAELGPLDGSFDWRKLEVAFDVPGEHCQGQWLELRNPAVGGAALRVSGDLWVDDVAVAPAI